MGSNIIELAKLGHERTAELKASCGAVDVRSLAKLISDLATQLEVQLVRGNAQAVQLANAESKCRELAAENAGLKAVIEAVQGVANQSQGIAGWHLNGAVAEWDEILPEINNAETPATDDFLAEVRAQGVEMAMEHMQSSGSLTFGDCYISLNEFAAQLRKGVRS